MTEQASGAWKFWIVKHEKIYCFIVAVPEEALAEKKLLAREGNLEILDRERLPERISAMLEMKSGDVMGWKPLAYG
jgi:hypothetical protein